MKGGSRQGQSKVKERSRQGQVKSKQYKHNLNRNYNLMGFDTIEINLVSIKNNYAGLCEAEKSIPQSLQTVSTKLDPTRGGGLISYFNFVQLDLT